MTHDEFIGQVVARARLDSRGAAEEVTRATLETLAERLAGGEPSDLGAQLPPEIGRHLQQQGAGAGQQFDLPGFYRRVGERMSHPADPPDTALYARAVMSVLRDAVSAGEHDQLADQLPADYGDLLAGLDARSADQRPGR